MGECEIERRSLQGCPQYSFSCQREKHFQFMKLEIRQRTLKVFSVQTPPPAVCLRRRASVDDVGRRRAWSDEEKVRIVEESLQGCFYSEWTLLDTSQHCLDLSEATGFLNSLDRTI